jgi:hypothetical protein
LPIFAALKINFKKSDSIGFWRWCITHRINGFSDFVHRLSSAKKFILNLSKCALTESEEAIVMKGLNFAVTRSHLNLDMAYAVESVVSKLPQTAWNSGGRLGPC